MDRLMDMPTERLIELANYYGIEIPRNPGGEVDPGRLVERIYEHELLVASGAEQPPIPPTPLTPAIPPPVEFKTEVIPGVLPLESDLATLNEIRQFVPTVLLVNPNATFAKNPMQPPPVKRAPRAPRAPTIKALPGIPITIVPPTAKPVARPIVVAPPTIPRIPTGPTVPAGPAPSPIILTPTARPVVQPSPAPTPTRVPPEIPSRVELPLTPTRLAPIPLPEPHETVVQLQVPHTTKQLAVFNINEIDPNRLTAGRAKKGDTSFYSREEMQYFARNLGLKVSGGKAELYNLLMNELRRRGRV